MKAELTDGSIITLDGPCEVGCITHTGPHWLHEDKLVRSANCRLLNGPVTAVLAHRVAELEIRRLDEKLQNMRKAGIVRLIRDGDE